MTAPGQEPDEVLTATPEGKGPQADEPDLGAIGDNLMPEDLREAARAEHEQAPDAAAPVDTGPGGDPATETDADTDGEDETETDTEGGDTDTDSESDTESEA